MQCIFRNSNANILWIMNVLRCYQLHCNVNFTLQFNLKHGNKFIVCTQRIFVWCFLNMYCRLNDHTKQNGQYVNIFHIVFVLFDMMNDINVNDYNEQYKINMKVVYVCWCQMFIKCFLQLVMIQSHNYPLFCIEIIRILNLFKLQYLFLYRFASHFITKACYEMHVIYA